MKKLLTTLNEIMSGPAGGIVLGLFLIMAFYLALTQPAVEIPFIYNQF
jgi:hypothetical protein